MIGLRYQYIRLSWWVALLLLGTAFLFFGGCAGQRFEPVTAADWVTWGYAEVETLANTVTEARQPDPVSGEPTLTGPQAAEIQARLNDVLAALQAAEIVVNRGGNAADSITTARTGIAQARLLLRTWDAI